MIPLTLHSIQEHLRSKQIEAEYQPETEQLYIVLKIGEQEYPLFVRIFEGNELLQLLAFLPCNTKTATLNDTARLLHLLNKELDTPGFGMEESSMMVFYRLMIPVYHNQVAAPLLEAYFNALQVVCKTFAAVIAAVALGMATFEEVVAKAKETDAQQSVAQSKLNAQNKKREK
jgi:hypothetical protein